MGLASFCAYCGCCRRRAGADDKSKTSDPPDEDDEQQKRRLPKQISFNPVAIMRPFSGDDPVTSLVDGKSHEGRGFLYPDDDTLEHEGSIVVASEDDIRALRKQMTVDSGADLDDTLLERLLAEEKDAGLEREESIVIASEDEVRTSNRQIEVDPNPNLEESLLHRLVVEEERGTLLQRLLEEERKAGHTGAAAI